MERAVAVQKRRLALAQLRARDEIAAQPTVTISQIDTLARAFVPGGGMHGVSRELIEGKFFLDRVPFGEPLIYVSQQGEPRIVLFGEQAELASPVLMSAWSDRLIMASDAPGDPIRLYFRSQNDLRSVSFDSVPQDMEGFVRFLAKSSSTADPRPGLGLGYAEIVGLLFELHRGGATLASFATENDRLLAQLLETVASEDIEVRPEAPGGEITLISADDPRQQVVDRSQTGMKERRTLLVPVNPVPDAPLPPGVQREEEFRRRIEEQERQSQAGPEGSGVPARQE
jgi:hypothetical protein